VKYNDAIAHFAKGKQSSLNLQNTWIRIYIYIYIICWVCKNYFYKGFRV
jgi:hypothetical protein